MFSSEVAHISTMYPVSLLCISLSNLGFRLKNLRVRPRFYWKRPKRTWQIGRFGLHKGLEINRYV